MTGNDIASFEETRVSEPYIEVLFRREVGTGRPIWLVDCVLRDQDGPSRIYVSDHYDLAGAEAAALEWGRKGCRVFWDAGARTAPR